MRASRLCIYVAVLLLSCGRSQHAAPARVENLSDVAARADTGTAPANAAPKRTTAIEAGTGPTAGHIKTYRSHLAAGRRFAGAKKWGEATAAFEKALDAMPDDARALTELGWAAFNAGDHGKARKANADAVKRTTDEKVKAAGLFNLGRIDEAEDHRPAAARLYQESLSLRPNQTVADRLKGLGQAVPAERAPELFCAAPMALDKVCACIQRHAESLGGSPDESECGIEPAPNAPGIRLLRAVWSRTEESRVLLGVGPTGWSVVALLDDVYNPGAFGISEDWELGPITVEDLGGKRLLKLTTRKTRQDSDLGINEVELVDTTTLTVCLLGQGDHVTNCPLQVPLQRSYVRTAFRDPADFDQEEKTQLEAQAKEFGTRGLPIRKDTELRVDFSPDGMATVVLIKGESSGGLEGKLGPTRLW